MNGEAAGLSLAADAVEPDGVEHGMLGVTGPIRWSGTLHSPAYRARGGATMPTAGYARAWPDVAKAGHLHGITLESDAVSEGIAPR